MKRCSDRAVRAIGFALLLTMLAVGCNPAAVPTPIPTKAPQASAPAAAPTIPATAVPPQPTAVPPSPTSRPVAIRFGSPGAISDAGIFIAIEKGYFKSLGLDVQVLPFQSAPLTIAPLSSGDLEVAGGAISTGLLNAIDRGVNLKVVAGKGSNYQNFNASWVTARKDLVDSGKIKTPKDLKGTKIAVAATKGGAESTVAFLLRQGGLTINDIELVALGYPDMVSGYANKAVDLGFQIEPTLTNAVEKGLAVRWAPGATPLIYGGEHQIGMLIFSEPFSKNADAARRFMTGYLKGLRDYNDAFAKGGNKDATISILTKYTSEKNPASYNNMGMPFLHPDGKLATASMKMDFDYFKDMGYYAGNLKFESIIDTQFTDYAVQQLGAYK